MKTTLFSALFLSAAALYAETDNISADILVRTSLNDPATTLTACDVSLTAGNTNSVIVDDTKITAGNAMLTFNSEGRTTLVSYAVTFTLDAITPGSSSNTSTLLSASRDSRGGVGAGVFIDAATSLVSFSSGTGQLSGSTTLSVSANDTLTFLHISQDGTGTSGLYYIVNQSTGSYIELSSDVYSLSGNASDLISGNATFWTNSGKAQMTVLGVTDLSGYSLDGSETTTQLNQITVGGITVYDNMLPEPATATLSLLALAGLAARRRRRQ